MLNLEDLNRSFRMKRNDSIDNLFFKLVLSAK